ncbi:MAG: hypothetical protein ACREQY_07120 [Candidatus Binatia bacterium]
MDDTSPPQGSRVSLSTILIIAGFVAIVVAIVAPMYLRTAYRSRKVDELAARAQPVLDALIEAERAYKEKHGTFWRDRHENLSAEATKEALGVDITAAPDYRLAVYPADLTADPTLRVAAKGIGEAQGIKIECVYDAIGRTKSCKRL